MVYSMDEVEIQMFGKIITGVCLSNYKGNSAPIRTFKEMSADLIVMESEFAELKKQLPKVEMVEDDLEFVMPKISLPRKAKKKLKKAFGIKKGKLFTPKFFFNRKDVVFKDTQATLNLKVVL